MEVLELYILRLGEHLESAFGFIEGRAWWQHTYMKHDIHK